MYPDTENNRGLGPSSACHLILAIVLIVPHARSFKLQAFDVASEITRCVSPMTRFTHERRPGGLLADEGLLRSPEASKAADVLHKWAKGMKRVNRALRNMEQPGFETAAGYIFGVKEFTLSSLTRVSSKD